MKRIHLALLAIVSLGWASGQSITIWTPLEGASLDWLQAEVVAYAETSELEVAVVPMPLGELRERMLAAEEGAAADLLVGVPHDALRDLAGAGVLAQLSRYATAGYLADLSESSRQAFTFDGELYGLPMYVQGPALVINSDLVPEPPDNYDEMLRLARDLDEGDTAGFVFDIANFYYSYTWLNSFGGYVFGRGDASDFDVRDIGLASEGAVRGAEELRALRFEHGLIPAGADYSLATALFLEGRLAMTYDGPWGVAAFVEAGVPVEVLPLPPRSNGGDWVGFANFYGTVLNRYSPESVTAANLAKWLVRPEAQIELAHEAGRVPVSFTAISGLDEAAEILAGYGHALATARPLIDVPLMGEVWQPMSDALGELMEDPSRDAEAVLRRAVRAIESAIEVP